MARRRKKKKSILGSVLKYEIYGIVLITLSVIALSGEAAVGRSLSKMFGLVLGKFYFVIPLIGIFVGLMVMINRKWPHQWNTRRSGVVLLVCALTLMSAISSMEQRLGPIQALEPGNVMSQIHTDMNTELLAPRPADDGSMLNKEISGGYVGALQLTLLLWLFGLTGAKLVMLVMFVISFMLITQLSYVDLAKFVRTRMGKVGGALQHKWNERQGPLAATRARAANGKIKAEPIPDYDDLEEDFEELEMPKKRQPLFFQLFGNKTAPAEDKSDATDSTDEDIYVAGRDDMPEVVEESENSKNAQQPSSSPIIRNFFEQVRSEEDPLDEDLQEDSYAGRSLNQPGSHAPLSDLEREPYSNMDNTLDSTVAITDSQAHVGNASAQDGMIQHPLDEEFGDEELPLPEEQLASETVTQSEEGAANGATATGTTVVDQQPQPKPYRLPPLKLLDRPAGAGNAGDQNDYMQTARKLEATLESFGVRAKVLEVVRGPAVTRYEIQPDIGVKVSRIVNLTDDIALALAAKDIRMEAPIPGKSAIGIEVPNSEVSVVTMREVMETNVFREAESKLSIAFGRDIAGQTIVGNLAKMPHLLVAGATGSGKSVCINGIITSILYKAKPDEVKFLMVDPKMVELNVYNGIPHLMAPVVTDPKRASLALKKIVVEMEKRYELFSKSGTRNVEGYNQLMRDNPAAVLPYIVVIVDELADLMMVAAGDVEDAIARLAQMARAAGIHLIIATQRPSVDVITGVIKANIPSRIAFGVSSQVDSRTILDMGGAEKLLGRGDMLFMPMGASKPVRVQGAFLSDQEVENIVSYVRDQAEAEYDESIVPEVEESSMEGEEIVDELYEQAVNIILEAKQASVSLLQRRMRIGYTRAARLIDSMEARGVIGPYEGSKPREVLISLEQYQQNKISS
ncbi:FtsK/SpoIIIE family DNA translocase [Paenibacillus sp. FSL K6-1230]|uniref:FtsK/SpoIIIE family DNA translocase n=1 Tax=Paenibacillus sp. FSL K6-1230 TaxID=2921603 RepID=UPI0003A9AB4F